MAFLILFRIHHCILVCLYLWVLPFFVWFQESWTASFTRDNHGYSLQALTQLSNSIAIKLVPNPCFDNFHFLLYSPITLLEIVLRSIM